MQSAGAPLSPMQLKSPHYNHAQLPHLVTLTGDPAAAAPQHWMLCKLSKPCSVSPPRLYPSLCCPRLHPLLFHFLVGGLEGVAVREAAAAPDRLLTAGQADCFPTRPVH